MPKFHDGPKVFLVAETKLEYPGILKFLHGIGADKYALDVRDNGTDRESADTQVGGEPDSLSEAEDLARLAGKLCYRSYEPGLNPNVSKVREGRRDYIAKSILAQGHGSVLEHSSMSFVFWRVSRVFTHELCRHRVGVAISQESMRYVRLDDMEFWMPGAFMEDAGLLDANQAAEAQLVIEEVVKVLEAAQKKLGRTFKLDDPAIPFDLKKKLTSAMRRIAPDGVSTSLLWTANFRTLRHVILLRTSPGAEEEIRVAFDAVAKICKQRHPAVFSDFHRQADGTWTCDNGQQPYDRKA